LFSGAQNGDTLVLSRSGSFLLDKNFPIDTKNNQIIGGILKKNALLWTVGPMINFSAGSKIRLDSNYRVIYGTPANDFFGLMSNNQYIKVKKKYPIRINKEGFIVSCTLGQDFAVNIRGQEIVCSEGESIKFTDKGNIWAITSSQNVKLEIRKDIFVTFAPGSVIMIDENGFVTRGTLAKRVNLKMSNNTTKIFRQGDEVFFDSNGDVISNE